MNQRWKSPKEIVVMFVFGVIMYGASWKLYPHDLPLLTIGEYFASVHNIATHPNWLAGTFRFIGGLAIAAAAWMGFWVGFRDALRWLCRKREH